MGVQNRPQEVPRGDKKYIEQMTWKRNEKEHQEATIRSNIEVFDLKKSGAVRLAECAGPLGRIIGGVRRDKKIN